jgi:hypothetical protein
MVTSKTVSSNLRKTSPGAHGIRGFSMLTIGSLAEIEMDGASNGLSIMMPKPITRSLISVAIFGVMQTSAKAQDDLTKKPTIPRVRKRRPLSPCPDHVRRASAPAPHFVEPSPCLSAMPAVNTLDGCHQKRSPV